MSFSIITVCYNSASTIEDTIKSVLAQNSQNLEYIIVDGGSTDGTLDIINKYKSRIAKIVSEPDKGIYDAMNKGLKMATGEIVGIINSDDFYIDNDVLNTVEKRFVESGADTVYGDIVYVDRLNTNKRVRMWCSGVFSENKIDSGWVPPHPAFFVKKSVYDKYGFFDIRFKIAADYELMLRFIKKSIKLEYINKTLVCMREGGNSASSLKQRIKGWQEIKEAWNVNGLKAPFGLILKRIFPKVKQFVFKK